MNYFSIIIPFVGGLGMFIYGMQIMASGLENAAGNRMKSLLAVLTKNKFFGVLLGLSITAVIQSSSATTVMVVGFVNAGIMNLNQAMGVIMGANIGTTVTGWIVSSVEWAKFLSPTTLAPIAVMAGVVIMLTGKRHSTKDISSIVIGFGLLFIGITSMSGAVAPLKESEAFQNIFVTLGRSPFLGILAGAVVTAIIQSSSASVGILQSLAATGLVPTSAAVYIIMGQNIGTCVTAILSSIGAKKNAKVAALMHLLFNVIGTAIFSVIAIVYLKIINPAAGLGIISQTQISIVHTIFNVGTTVLIFPVSGLIVKLAKKIGKAEEGGQKESSVLLDDRMLETPSIALQSTVSEVLRMGQIVSGTLEKAKIVLFEKKRELITEIKSEEKTVDKLCGGITDYTIKLTSLQINEKEHTKAAHLLQVISDIERISDYCENIAEFAENIHQRKLEFSEAGKSELKEMIEVSVKSYKYAMIAFETGDKDYAVKVIEEETKADELEISLREKHIQRLTSGQCNAEIGVVYLDAIICLERISDHARNIAEEVLKEVI